MPANTAIEHGPPPRGAYRFVLRHPRILPIQSMYIVGYDETAWTRAVEWDGVEVQMLFIKGPNFYRRMQRHIMGGWIDITKAWFDGLDEYERTHQPAIAIPPPEPSLIDDLTAPAQAMYMALQNGGPMAKKDLVNASGIELYEWNKSIKALVAEDFVTKVGRGRSLKYHAVIEGEK